MLVPTLTSFSRALGRHHHCPSQGSAREGQTPERAVSSEVLSLLPTVVLDTRKRQSSELTCPHSLLHVAGISAPRMGSMAREDEPFSFASREYLRTLLVGKEVGFNITHTLPATSGPGSVSCSVAPFWL